MRASHWATIPTDIVPICLSAGSAEVHLARPNTPGRARPRAPLGLVGQVMATTTLVAPEYASPVAGTSDAWYDLRSQGPSVFGFDRLFRGRIYERPVGQHIARRA